MAPLRRALLLFVLAPVLAAQWSSIAHDPAHPVVAEGFLALHQNALGVQVFSAAGQRWRLLSPPGSQVLGTGDWTALVQEGSNFRAYSARHDSSALLLNVVPGLVRVEDDVILLVDVQNPFAPTAYGYSAQFGDWVGIGLVTQVGDAEVASSRFVIAIRDETDYLGFAARTGAWEVFDHDDFGADPEARGNVALANLASPDAALKVRKVAAFSGVRGTWSVSPVYRDQSPIVLEHNVAAVELAGGGKTFGCAYSAYSGAWVTSLSGHTNGGSVLASRANWVRIEEPGALVRFEAFGALPGAAWTSISGQFQSLYTDADDCILLRRTDKQEVHGFSAITAGGWVALPIASSLQLEPGPTTLALVRDGSTRFAAFSPARAAFGVLDSPAGGIALSGDAVATVFSTQVPFTGFSTRSGRWTVGPETKSGSLVSALGGSLAAFQQKGGTNANRVAVFDERCDCWSELELGFAALFDVAENLVVVRPNPASAPLATEVLAFSAQTGRWSSPLEPVAFPLLAAPPPLAEENVAVFVDAAGRLFAYGSPQAGHVWHQWPNGTELHVSAGVGANGALPFVGYSIRAAPGSVAFGFAAAERSFPGLKIPGIGGLLALDLATFVHLGALTIVEPDGLAELRFPLQKPLTPGAQLWLQPVLLDLVKLAASFPDRADPVLLF